MSEKQELRIALSDANAKICELRKQNADLAEENLAAHLVNKEFADEVRELKKLSEERRVALVKCSPFGWNTSGTDKCYFCKAKITDTHKPNCDWVRLSKA